VITTDGVKLRLGPSHWLMLRFSGTEPLLRLYCEAPSEARVADGHAVGVGQPHLPGGHAAGGIGLQRRHLCVEQPALRHILSKVQKVVACWKRFQ
jgi:hypothetical protein